MNVRYKKSFCNEEVIEMGHKFDISSKEKNKDDLYQMVKDNYQNEVCQKTAVS